MRVALKAIGYTAATAGIFAAVMAVWLAVTFGVAEIAVRLGASRAAAPLYGLLFWGLIASGGIGLGIAVEESRKEQA